MTLKTPSFWYPKNADETSMKARFLKPISYLYTLGFNAHQNMTKTQKADIPVICIGNLVAGGTGKTPTAIALMNFIRDKGFAKNPHFLLRGYGGAERGPLRVELNAHNAWDVGDESLILANHAPTIVSADRIEGAALAAKQGADMIIMDDGLQNPHIHKDIKIVVINCEMGFGNALTMPAGPMREPLEKGLNKADAFLLIGDDKNKIAETLPKEKPVLYAHLEADKNFTPDKNIKYLAFAGLGYPDKFFNFLKNNLGLNIAEEIRFADHCPYDQQDLDDLRAKAAKLNAKLITTEKDFLRLPKTQDGEIIRPPVSMVIDTPENLQGLLESLQK